LFPSLNRPETKENKEGADTEKTAEHDKNDTEKELEKDKVNRKAFMPNLMITHSKIEIKRI
jgi:hypothetical protein